MTASPAAVQQLLVRLQDERARTQEATAHHRALLESAWVPRSPQEREELREGLQAHEAHVALLDEQIAWIGALLAPPWEDRARIAQVPSSALAPFVALAGRLRGVQQTLFHGSADLALAQLVPLLSTFEGLLGVTAEQAEVPYPPPCTCAPGVGHVDGEGIARCDACGGVLLAATMGALAQRWQDLVVEADADAGPQGRRRKARRPRLGGAQ